MFGGGSPVDYSEMRGSCLCMENQSQWSWFHCDSLVSHSLTLDSIVEAETGLRPSLYQFRNVHPFQVILLPRAVTEEWLLDMCFKHHLKCYDFALAGLERAFWSLSCAADCFFPNIKGMFFLRIIFPPTRLSLPDWLSVRCYHLYYIAEHFLSSGGKFECIFFL